MTRVEKTPPKNNNQKPTNNVIEEGSERMEIRGSWAASVGVLVVF
jgi:uncharacterized Zn-binding protein involved in type VI secretion